MGLNAGLDQEGGFGTYEPVDAIPAAVAAGRTTSRAVSTAFRRLFRARMRLGMLDPPSLVEYNNATFSARAQNEDEQKLALATRAAVEGMTLLKNDRGALPLSLPRAGAPVACVAHANTDSNVGQEGSPSVMCGSATDCASPWGVSAHWGGGRV